MLLVEAHLEVWEYIAHIFSKMAAEGGAYWFTR